MEFVSIDGYSLEAASTGRSGSRILVFRFPDGDDVWDRVPDTRILLIGGNEVKHELKELLSSAGRSVLQQQIPGGLSGSVHTSLRRHLGL